MHLEDIRVYPIKSCGGISLESANLEARGLEHDRRFMLVDANDRFVTLRSEPTLPFVALAIEGDRYRVTFPDGRSLTIAASDEGTERRRVVVWDDSVEATVLAEASDAFSEFLGATVRLVHLPDDVIRPVNPKRAREGDQVSFADAYPLLLMSRASVEDLSSRVGRTMDMRRFRPNLVFGGGEPYVEDFFAEVAIGSLTFRGPKACSRCVATTIDPDDGTKSVEPLRTLARYRRANGEVFLGMNLIHDSTGRIAIGDRIDVLRRHRDAAFGTTPTSSS